MDGGIVADVACPSDRGVFDDRDECIGDLFPLFLTPLFPDMCQSVPGQYGGPARLPMRHVLPRKGLAALHQHESFPSRAPAKCVRIMGINKALWINKHS